MKGPKWREVHDRSHEYSVDEQGSIFLEHFVKKSGARSILQREDRCMELLSEDVDGIEMTFRSLSTHGWYDMRLFFFLSFALGSCLFGMIHKTTVYFYN